jgi:RNA polymerase sigma factor (sigma-70 family)
MRATPPQTAAHDLRTLYDSGALGGLTDGQLLERFVTGRDEAAFEVLIRRHGTLVWGVCRRILSSHHDAEDAFQATFLVLARKAASILPREMLPNWLHGVARQTAMKARGEATRRRRREKPVAVLPESLVVIPEPERPDEHLAWLDRELGRLPEKYRTAIVLCELEGLTHQEAARRIGCPVGTLSARLSRGRTLLARRLTRCGVAIPAGGIAVLLAPEAASAGVTASLAWPTARAAALFASGRAIAPGLISAKALYLAQGAIKTLLLGKLELVMMIATSVAVLGSAGALLARPPATRREQPIVAQRPPERLKPAREPDKQGPILTGRIVDEGGRPLPGVKIVLYGGLVTRWKGQETTTDQDGRYRFDPLRTGAYFKQDPSGRWDWRPGMRLMHPTHVSADGKSWWDIDVPGIDRQEHAQDFRMVPGGWLKGRVLDPKTKKPLRRLDLRIGGPDTRRPKFHVYARTDDAGQFTSEPLFPGEYAIDVNVPELNYPVLGRVQIEARKTLEQDLSQDRLRWAIAKGVTAINGKNRLEEIKAITMTTRETHDDGRQSTTKHFILIPDRYRCELRYDGDDKTLISIFSARGVRQWYKQDDGQVREVTLGGIGAFLIHRPEFWEDIKYFGPRAVLRLEDLDYQPTLLDDGRVGDKEAFGMELNKREPGLWLKIRMFFDLDTGVLLKQADVREGIETLLDDYKEFNVVPVARKMTIKTIGGKTVVTSELVDFKAEDTIAVRFFQGP